MRIYEISPDFNNEQESFEQLKAQAAININQMFNVFKKITNDFDLDINLISDESRRDLLMIQLKMYALKRMIIDELGDNSNALQKIKWVMDYMKNI